MSRDALVANGAQALAMEILDLIEKRHAKRSNNDLCMIAAMATACVNASMLAAAGVEREAARALVLGCFDAVLASIE